PPPSHAPASRPSVTPPPSSSLSPYTTLFRSQRLSLNPSQISGVCGRLMSCLIYEHDAYVQARKKFPREGKTLTTSRGKEKVVSVDRKSTRLNSSHVKISYAVFCLKKKVEAQA